MKKYVLALDQGTTSCRSILFDRKGAVASIAQKEFRQHFPHPGYVEHDPEEIWQTQTATAMEALHQAGVSIDEIAAIGITNQRETVVAWEKKSGKPLCNAIVWQDRRTASLCDTLKAGGKEQFIRDKTGLVIDAYFSATKFRWILDNIPGAREKADENDLCLGTVDSWLLYRLTSGRVHATDVSNASRTMLCNISTLQWDDDLLKMFDIPPFTLPEIKSSSEIYGYTDLFDAPVPVAGIAGDQQAALFGQLCVSSGMVKNTYGTGCFMLMNTGNKPVPSDNNLLTTVAWQINGQTTYALEGSVFIAGAAVQWLRDNLGIIQSSEEIETLAAKAEDNGGVCFVPAFTGLGAPYWSQDARGMITGLTRGSMPAHIARATLESIAYQTMDVLTAMEADSTLKIKELRVDGGASVNNLLMQFQSDILNTKVVRPVITETTALGAAYLAGLATGFWNNIEELNSQWQINRVFDPSMTMEKRKILSEEWHSAVKAVLTKV